MSSASTHDYIHYLESQMQCILLSKCSVEYVLEQLKARAKLLKEHVEWSTPLASENEAEELSVLEEIIKEIEDAGI